MCSFLLLEEILEYELFSCSRDVGWIQERTEAGQEPTLILSQAKNQLQKSTPQKINSKNQLHKNQLQKSTKNQLQKSTIRSRQSRSVLSNLLKNQLFWLFRENHIPSKINYFAHFRKIKFFKKSTFPKWRWEFHLTSRRAACRP